MFLASPAHSKDSFILILVESHSFSFEKIKRKMEKKGSKREDLIGSGWGDVGGTLTFPARSSSPYCLTPCTGSIDHSDH